MRFPRRIVWSMGLIKYSAAKANVELGLLDPKIGEAVMRASKELAEGAHDQLILVEVLQTGSGTGLNMNVNEVIAARASELSGLKIHPNDHVNMGQSSNDVVPTAIRIAAAAEVRDSLVPASEALLKSLEDLVARTEDVVKPGRTHLRDALPVTMGQEFSAYHSAFKKDLEALEPAVNQIKEVPIGGTAVGTGINTHPRFGELVVDEINKITGLGIRVADNRFRAMRLLTDMLGLSSVLRSMAVDLMRLCQDLRLMFSGPFTAIGEIDMPQEVAGSSIMPGKTNPVTVEASMLAASQIIGLDTANTHASLLGEFELSMGIPLVGYNVVTQIAILSEAFRKLSTYALDRVIPMRERARELAEKSPALVTIISPIIGYDRAAQVASRIAQGVPIRRALREIGLGDEEIEKLLSLERLTRPGIPAKES